MKIIRSFIAGLAGAGALNLLHESVRRFDSSAPRIDLLGEQALSKGVRKLDLDPPSGDDLYAATLAADVVSNTSYYAMIGMGGNKNVYIRAIGMGLAAGFGALKLPEPMGLSDKPVASTDKRQIMTVGYYLFGALVTAVAFKALSKSK